MTDNATNATAVAGITSPAWLPGLQDVSHIAADMMPICGVTWLLLQIILKIRDRLRETE